MLASTALQTMLFKVNAWFGLSKRNVKGSDLLKRCVKEKQ